jgi:hypothetical protein
LLVLFPSIVRLSSVTSLPLVVPIPTKLLSNAREFPLSSFASLPKNCCLIMVFFPVPEIVNEDGMISLFVRYVPLGTLI